MRALLIGVVVVLGIAGVPRPASAGRGAVVVNTGDDVLHLRDLTAEQAAAVGYGKLGYRYELFGVFWMDLWRWDGEFVVYSGNVYAPLDADQLAALGGGSVPWRYRLPPGLLLILAGIELAIITRTRRRLKTTLAIGGFLVVVAAAFYVMGLDWEFLIPLFLGGHHIIGSYFEVKRQREREEEAAVTAEVMRASAPQSSQPSRPAHPVSTPPPVEPAIASRPSQPPPLVVERPPTAPATVPMRADDSAGGPKLLR